MQNVRDVNFKPLSLVKSAFVAGSQLLRLIVSLSVRRTFVLLSGIH